MPRELGAKLLSMCSERSRLMSHMSVERWKSLCCVTRRALSPMADANMRRRRRRGSNSSEMGTVAVATPGTSGVSDKLKGHLPYCFKKGSAMNKVDRQGDEGDLYCVSVDTANCVTIAPDSRSVRSEKQTG
jgi:hypothetical protein